MRSLRAARPLPAFYQAVDAPRRNAPHEDLPSGQVDHLPGGCIDRARVASRARCLEARVDVARPRLRVSRSLLPPPFEAWTARGVFDRSFTEA